MLMHTVAASFFKISREIRNEERCGYVHCTCQIVSSRMKPIMPNFGSQSFSRKFENSSTIDLVVLRKTSFGKFCRDQRSS
ncbi:hypothetical protein T11_10614 [Trichinella zimbabwensis]|uniref:Uncharacterized protein n=1 Tax=Trichinella zimbabwensis TaxID=268475 RepID=A0A0V1HS50_9BILA|nr:hypothetical protein T11_10614 [Trichinella zimbabwensis]